MVDNGQCTKCHVQVQALSFLVPKVTCHVPWMLVMLPTLKAKLMTDKIRDVYRIGHMSTYKSVNTVQCMEHHAQVDAMPPRMSSVLNGKLLTSY